jgi:hypothetical protein
VDRPDEDEKILHSFLSVGVRKSGIGYRVWFE